MMYLTYLNYKVLKKHNIYTYPKTLIYLNLPQSNSTVRILTTVMSSELHLNEKIID